MAIVRYTFEEAMQLPDLTDWERLRNMRDEDIDYSDIPEWTDEDFARAYRPGQMTPEELAAKRRECLELQRRQWQAHQRSPQPKRIPSLKKLQPEAAF